MLDRNGLRPSRYYVTKDDLVVMASEVGVLDIPADRVLEKGRLQPGRMFLVDTAQGPHRRRRRDQAPDRLGRSPTAAGWKENLVSLDDLPPPPTVIEPDHETVLRRQEAFGYTTEDIKVLVAPMATDGVEAMGSMGNDTPLAVLSERPQLLYNYFKQLFAQVTNPPVDAIREEIIMAVDTAIGPEGNLLEPTPASARQISLPTPVLRNEELEKLRHLNGVNGSHGFKSITLPMLFKVADGGAGLRKAIEDLRRCSEAIAERPQHHHPLRPRARPRPTRPSRRCWRWPAVQHHLLREGSRTRVGLVLETGEPREVHHFALLIGYGASAINPYLAFETIHDMIRPGAADRRPEKAEQKYVKAVGKGIVKVISKMGISTIQSYHGAQVFEAIGLNHRLHRRVLHLDGVAHRRHRHRRGRRRRCAGATRAPSPIARCRPTRWTRAASTSTAATASTTCSTPRPSTSCSTPAAPATTPSSRSTPSWSTTRPSTCARCAA